jgi:hypothetical protein
MTHDSPSNSECLAEEDDKKFGQSIAQWKNAASGGIGTGIGVGTSFIATPVVGGVHSRGPLTSCVA